MSFHRRTDRPACDAILRLRTIGSEAGFPLNEYVLCGQTQGLRVHTDLNGDRWHWCSAKNSYTTHESDVRYHHPGPGDVPATVDMLRAITPRADWEIEGIAPGEVMESWGK